MKCHNRLLFEVIYVDASKVHFCWSCSLGHLLSCWGIGFIGVCSPCWMLPWSFGSTASRLGSSGLLRAQWIFRLGSGENSREKTAEHSASLVFFVGALLARKRWRFYFDSHSDFACAKSCPSNEIKHLLVKEGMKRFLSYMVLLRACLHPSQG